MAASVYTIQFRNGQTLSVYQAANQAVNSSPVCTLLGQAASTTTTTDFSLANDTVIDDVVVTSALTQGGIEFYNVSRSQRTGRGIFDLSPFLITNTTRKPPKLMFKAGRTYRIIQTTAGNA